MKRISHIALLCLTILTAALAGCAKQDKVINVADDDPEMVAAIAKARNTLPQFWQVFDKPEHGEKNFALKVKITDKKGTEHFWLTEIERKDGKLLGTINNDPDIVGNVKFGDRMTIPEVDISDWMYMRAGKMFGNYTIRVLFKEMPAKEVEQFKKMLAEP